MSKATSSAAAKRKRFAQTVLAEGGKIDQVYRRFGIGRSTAHDWWGRFLEGGEAALEDQRRGRPHGSRRWAGWKPEVLNRRQRRPSSGPDKLRYQLERDFPRQPLPSERTIARILKEAGCVARRRRQPGPALPRPELTQPRRSNDVWTIDFKGDFRTGDGKRCLPLTVRDLHSRFVLLVEHVPVPSERALRRVLRRCFARYGLPRVFRVDNGKPFGGGGACGLTGLSAWWQRLGIEVQFIRPGQPQDNGAHEQMHRVLKQETAAPPAPTLRAQAHRFRTFCHWYNHQRPHQAHGKVPAQVYRPTPAKLPKLKPFKYPPGWLCKRVSGGGVIRWAGRPRMIGRAFKHENVGLKRLPAAGKMLGAVMQVYFGELLLGELHASDQGTLRGVRYRRDRRGRK
jgi:transposase InsO family protein